MMSVLHTAPAQSIYNNQDDQPNWPISTRQRPCGPKPGTTDSRLVFPPELRPHNHILQVTLFLRGVRTVANEQRMCYVFVAQTSRGPQPIAVAPLLHVRQGDHMDVTIVNEMVAPVHHVADYNNNPNAPAEALKIQRAEQDDSMASMHDMSGMDGGSAPGESDVHHMGCGQTIIEALPTPEPQTGRIYGLHRAPFEDTNIHFHGLNTSPKLPHDDVVDVLVCPKLKSGDPASQFHYSIDIPRDEPPGLYWYHPHAHGESEHELLQGVTGAILVDTATPSVPDTLTSRVLVMRDYIPLGGGTAKPRTIPSVGVPNFLEIRKQVQAEGLDGPAGWDGPLVNTGLNPIGPGQGCPNPPFPPNTDAKDLTVNGMIIPEDPGQIKYFPETSIKYGETQFYRVVNTGADTTLDLELTTDNRHNKMMVVSRDGVPIVTQNGRPTWQPVPMDHVLLMPAARVEFYVTGSAPGATMKLSALKFDTGCLGDVTLTRALLKIHVGRKNHDPVRYLPPPVVDPGRIRFSDLAQATPVKHRVFAFTEYNEVQYPQFQDLYITELSNPKAVETPFSLTGPPAVVVKDGTVEDWTILNYTREIHDFHIHQIHFLVMSHSGLAAGEGQLLDSVFVPHATFSNSTGTGQVTPGSVHLRMDFRSPDIIGEFVYHCHILEHEDNGMMQKIRVVP
jgi:FtsP/CotA-like multicopper oxidase with cupredoxin domain